ncbi:hypothetical protein [Oceanobacillus massiliensis]|uniref:hypothetical protein n=1 Tax=Oceanobacillus massiliensis TaxID=1465765 RepID=UPI000289087C|nr:hypothetical protein [Oceanobacillus massiliensis]
MKYIMMLASVLILAACGNGNSNTADSQHTVVEESNASVKFQNLDLKTEGNEFVLTGEASATEGAFFYVIDQEAERIVEEQRITLEADPGVWEDFEIKGTLPETVRGKEAPPMILLYGKDANDKTVNPNYIPIDIEE